MSLLSQMTGGYAIYFAVEETDEMLLIRDA